MTGLVLQVGMLVGCVAPRDVQEPPPDIVLVVLDTVRADHVSAYGYAQRTTPNLDRFAAGAVRYPHARSSAPWTLPSHASMFTGHLPSAHGAHLQPDGTPAPYDGRFPTLAEVLGEAGYRTGAIVANTGYLTPAWGLARGFGDYEVIDAPAAAIGARAVAWLERGEAEGRPGFLFVNVMDAHRPYRTAPGMQALDQLKEAVLPGTADAPEPLVGAATRAYDTALASLDRGLGPLLDHLHAARDHTVVVITSDHGEFLGEHRWAEHPRDVYDAGIAVPLIVSHSGGGRGVAPDDPIFSHDLPRIVLEAADQGALSHRFPTDRPPMSEAHHDHAHYLARPELHDRMARVRRAWFEGSQVLIETEGVGGDRPELYDLQSDPGQRHDLAATEPETLARMRAALQAALEALPAAGSRSGKPPLAAPDPSPEERAQLRALGYVE